MLRYLLFLLPALSPLVADAGGSTDMVIIPGGSYLRPLEREGKPRPVASFWLDRLPVTNREFLAFVAAHPQWQRSRVNSLFADESYLKHWQNDLELGPLAPLDAPVVNVSWYAARAYLKTVAKRLPTVDEWEFAARADPKKADATKDPAFKAKILQWYATPNPTLLPSAASFPADIHGVRALHGLVWEWNRDFISALATGESRADGSSNNALFCGGAGLNRNNATEYADFMRFALRSSLRGNYCLTNLGFRGAKSLTNPDTKTQ